MKAKMITTATKQYDTSPHQWWEKTESGKAWRLWEKDPAELLTCLKTIPVKEVYWVIEK